MAIRWHWAFGAESAATLVNPVGFGFSGTLGDGPTSSPSLIYTYASSPARYSWQVRNRQAMKIPTEAYSGVYQGWVAFPAKASANVAAPNVPIVTIGPGVYSTGNPVEVYISTGPVASLYMGGVFQGSTGVLDFSQWHYFAVKYDLSTTTHSAELYIDGVSVLGPFTRAGTASPDPAVAFWNGYYSPTILALGQIIIYDDPADAGEVPRFVTRLPPNEDGTDVGTWAPSTGSTDWEVVDPPIDLTTYSQCVAISPGDRLEVGTGGGGADIQTTLGISAGSAIDSVMQHAYVQAFTATWDGHVAVELGGSETAGSTVTVSTSGTTYLYAVANTKPGGGAWAGTDAPSMRVEAD